MMQILKQRVLVTLAATVVALACGMAAGFLLGRYLTLRRAEIKLKQFATLTMTEADASSRESRAVLADMNASPYPFCSDAEIAYFRSLLFQSEYLKEAGRMRGGKIDCSATLGRLPQPLAQSRPDFAQSDGTRVYKQFAPFRVDHLTVVSLQLGDSYVIFSPFLEAHRAAPPMHYISTAIDDANWQVFRSISAFPQATKAVLTRNGEARLGGTLYATRCSARYFNCVTDYIAVPDALRADRRELAGYLAAGGLIGACFGFLVSILYRRNQSMDRQLRRAIAHDKLRVVYQPIVHLASRRIVGAEALARWTDEEGFEVGPDVFIRIAEGRGFVEDITRFVARRVLQDFAETLRSHPDFRLSINVASADLGDPGFLPMLDSALEKAGVSAQSLAIEITESCTAQHDVAIAAILGLRERGHSVHIDDFGTGYSSLSYLHALSIDAIKIDKSFTHAIGTEAVTVSILPQILAMAETLKLGVIVEGVETGLQAEYFETNAQPVLAQGWLFGHPVPAEEFFRILAEDEEKAQVDLCGL
jgi:sensor c-di-GMP phosphodiesterase-like protein